MATIKAEINLTSSFGQSSMIQIGIKHLAWMVIMQVELE